MNSNSHPNLDAQRDIPLPSETDRPDPMETEDLDLSTEWSTPEVGYFMPGEYVAGLDKPLQHMHTDKYFTIRFYNVHAFVGHLRGLLVFKEEPVVRANIHCCLREDALDWYNIELTDSERLELRTLPVEEGWFKKLIQRFKLPESVARFRLETAGLHRRDFSMGKSARNMLRYAQAVGIDSPEEQLSFVWKSFKLQECPFDDIDEPGPDTSISEFMREIDVVDWEHRMERREQDRCEDSSFGCWGSWAFNKYENMGGGEEMSEELKRFLKKQYE